MTRTSKLFTSLHAKWRAVLPVEVFTLTVACTRGSCSSRAIKSACWPSTCHMSGFALFEFSKVGSAPQSSKTLRTSRGVVQCKHGDNPVASVAFTSAPSFFTNHRTSGTLLKPAAATINGVNPLLSLNIFPQFHSPKGLSSSFSNRPFFASPPSPPPCPLPSSVHFPSFSSAIGTKESACSCVGRSIVWRRPP